MSIMEWRNIHLQPGSYTKEPYWCGWKISVEIISVDHNKFLVKVDFNVGPRPRIFPEVFIKTSDQHTEYYL